MQKERETQQINVIEPKKGWIPIDFRELWDFRELMFYLTWRDILLRYKQTVLGILWVIIQPLLAVAVFSIVFGKFGKLPSGGVPYPVFAFCALLPWNLFANGLSRATNSVVGNANMLKKIYFPRMLIPVSGTLSPLVDFAISFVILLLVMSLGYHIPLRWNIIFIPVFVMLSLFLTLGVGFWLSAVNVKYRDVGYVLPFLIQIWLYASPVAYSIELVPEKWQFLYALNPMVGVINGFSWAILGSRPVQINLVIMSFVIGLCILISGSLYFKRMEKTFSDIV